MWNLKYSYNVRSQEHRHHKEVKYGLLWEHDHLRFYIKEKARSESVSAAQLTSIRVLIHRVAQQRLNQEVRSHEHANEEELAQKVSCVIEFINTELNVDIVVRHRKQAHDGHLED